MFMLIYVNYTYCTPESISFAKFSNKKTKAAAAGFRERMCVTGCVQTVKISVKIPFQDS